MSAPDYDIELWVVKLGTMSSYLFVFDLLVRAIHTIALIYSYWNKSAVHLPQADLRKRRDTSGSSWLSVSRLLASSCRSVSHVGHRHYTGHLWCRDDVHWQCLVLCAGGCRVRVRCMLPPPLGCGLRF
jgi:hypothetical protein